MALNQAVLETTGAFPVITDESDTKKIEDDKNENKNELEKNGSDTKEEDTFRDTFLPEVRPPQYNEAHVQEQVEEIGAGG
ncbi:hypothetical protein NDU88_006218 [Pleurodeles waltl]|uniref:Uncharacterized protein n=1 Tax=Pleurodeles waltl TaxID=8319 RepID=A0AAV7RMF4_PLEWA|nr:hypothetical protein NDU88_006218 [Pleurodeles waltl]